MNILFQLSTKPLVWALSSNKSLLIERMHCQRHDVLLLGAAVETIFGTLKGYASGEGPSIKHYNIYYVITGHVRFFWVCFQSVNATVKVVSAPQIFQNKLPTYIMFML